MPDKSLIFFDNVDKLLLHDSENLVKFIANLQAAGGDEQQRVTIIISSNK